MNKKISNIIAIGIITLLAIAIGGLFLGSNKNKAQDVNKNINKLIRSEEDSSPLTTDEEKQNTTLQSFISINGVKVEIIRGEKYCEDKNYPDIGYQQSLKVSYEDKNKKEKIIYTTSNKIKGREISSDDGCFFMEGICGLNLSPDGKYLIFNKTGWESSKPYMINIDSGKYVFGDKGDIFIIRNILWSSNNKNFFIITDVNEMAGAGELGIYVSEYNNPDKIKRVWMAKNYLRADIKEVNFIGNDKISFNVEQSECPRIGEVCPDGTVVHQVGPNCEFEDCTTENKAKEAPKKILKYEYSYKENKLNQIK